MARELHIMIADDHPVFRQGLRQVIEDNKSFKVTAEAGDGEQAFQLLAQQSFDVAILDVDMPGKNGVEVMRALQETGRIPDVIFLTMYNDEEIFDEAMDLGVRGYVLKESAARDILDSIKTVTSGKHYISPTIAGYLVRRSKKGGESAKAKSPVELLTSSERRILRLIADGKTSKEISRILNRSPKTVDNHRLNITRKLELHGTHSLLKFAVRYKKDL